MSLLTSLLLLVTVSRLLGRLAKGLGQNEIVGEIFAGLLLGPSILGLVSITPELKGVVELGVFLLIFSAGLEIEFHEIVDAIKGKALGSAIVGFLLPLISGILLCMQFGFEPLTATVVGLCLAITALPIVVRLLSANNLIDSKFGHNVLGAAVIIDILALLVLGVVFDLKQEADFLSILKTVGITSAKIILFFLIVLMVNRFLRKEITTIERTRKVIDKMFKFLGEEAVFGIAVLFVLLFSTVTEELGLHFIIGAFFGGLLLNKDIIGDEFFPPLTRTLDSVSSGFLTPVFFAFIGLQLTTDAFSNLGFLAAVFAVAFLSKGLGGYVGSRIVGVTHQSSLKMGIFLNARGVLDLVIADIAFDRGYIGADVFSILVIIGISSTVLSPIAYKILCKPSQESDSESISQEISSGSSETPGTDGSGTPIKS